jgi:E3 ubiquitin-protein ligase RBBP6
MSIHYKFKSAIDYDTITFDGLHISVSDLKKAIVHQKKLGKATDFDLMITNAQTNEGKIFFLRGFFIISSKIFLYSLHR